MTKFENSVIKDICYHGTSSESFTVLDKSKIQKNPEDGDAGYFGWGFYLTTDKDYAEEYGDNILAFKVNIQNPFTTDKESYRELVEFLFKDCNQLQTRVKETLGVINMIGHERGDFFEANNSRELLEKCKELYNKYREANISSKYLREMRDVLSELALNEDNWLNGLFFYFGRELFHYITMMGYDGIIAQGGKEIVVYETEQLQPVDDMQEDLELDVLPLPDWERGGEQYTKELEDSLRSNPDVTHYEIYQKIYPERRASVWYNDGGLFFLRYKDLLEVWFYRGGEIWIYRDEDDEEGISSVEDLEGEGVYTDRQYYAYMNEDDKWGNGWADDNTAYFGFVVTPLKNNPNQRDEFYAYDIGYEDWSELDEIIPIDWVFEKLIPEFIEDNPEYFTEDGGDKEEDSKEEVTEEVKPVKKHITKAEVLKNVIDEFGYITTDNLTDAIYLLPNGKILDTKGHNNKSQHENVAKYISEKYKMSDMDENNGSKFMSDISAMRITPWIPAMFIPEAMLTEKQEDALYDILVKLLPKVSKDSPLMIASPDGQQIEYRKVDNPEDIITSILGYQVLGILKESAQLKGSEMKFLKRIRG